MVSAFLFISFIYAKSVDCIQIYLYAHKRIHGKCVWVVEWSSFTQLLGWLQWMTMMYTLLAYMVTMQHHQFSRSRLCLFTQLQGDVPSLLYHNVEVCWHTADMRRSPGLTLFCFLTTSSPLVGMLSWASSAVSRFVHKLPIWEKC